nr:hypothetical protein Itr_chr03CG15830 [Ipomoea trifida]
MTPDVQSRLPNVFLVLLRRQAARGRHPTGRTMDVGEGGAKLPLPRQAITTVTAVPSHRHRHRCTKA